MSHPLFRPFPGLRPSPALASKVAAPPYDVVSTAEAAELAKGNPASFLNISRPEINLPPGTDPHAPQVYAKARETLDRMKAEGTLVADTRPVFYVYRLRMGEHVQTGLVGGASVEAYVANRVRKHEYTRPDKEDDRVRQIDACDAQTGPVLLAHPDDATLADAIARVVAAPPLYSVTTGHDGVEHTLWIMDDASLIARVQSAFDAFDAIYIADGHHRSAAAARVAKARNAQSDNLAASFLAVSFPISEMRILEYNRVVRDLNGLSVPDFLGRIAEFYHAEKLDTPARPARPGEIGLYTRDGWVLLTPKLAAPSDPVAGLDVSLLSDRILGPVLGIRDLRTDRRIDFVGGRRGVEELRRLVDSGAMEAAFALFPTRMSDLVAVAEAGCVMPPKSTWFEPKLADGLVSYPLTA